MFGIHRGGVLSLPDRPSAIEPIGRDNPNRRTSSEAVSTSLALRTQTPISVRASSDAQPPLS